ncbi:MAG: chemotaxis protein CheW [candidate division KSB1 bacterium]|nr:chemotaxis protein CheW [candidate division KSB1 bacterium]
MQSTVIQKHFQNRRSNESTKPFATFYLQNEFFGIDVEWVQEILKYQEMTPVPLAPEYVCGLINLRGQIVMAMDLKARLHGKPNHINASSMNLIVKDGDEIISLLVDDIGDVLELDENDMHPVPLTMTSMNTEYFDGVYRLENQLLLILNVKNVLS